MFALLAVSVVLAGSPEVSTSPRSARLTPEPVDDVTRVLVAEALALPVAAVGAAGISVVGATLGYLFDAAVPRPVAPPGTPASSMLLPGLMLGAIIGLAAGGVAGLVAGLVAQAQLHDPGLPGLRRRVVLLGIGAGLTSAAAIFVAVLLPALPWLGWVAGAVTVICTGAVPLIARHTLPIGDAPVIARF